MDQNQIDLFQTVCFLALMQHGKGLIMKGPKYIQEKMKTSKALVAAWQMLDDDGQIKVVQWARRWDFPLQELIEKLSGEAMTS